MVVVPGDTQEEHDEMNLGLHGQAAVVVGAARGIGLAIAEVFAAEEANLALVDREPAVEQTAVEIARKAQVQAVSWVADVTDYAAMQRAASECCDRLGRIDHVVFAVGVGSGKFGFPY